MSILPPTLSPAIAPAAMPHLPTPALFRDLARDDVFRLETARLWLRWPRLADAGALNRQASEKVVADMTANILHPYPQASTEPAIFEARKGNALGQHLALAVTRKERPLELIGMISARRSVETGGSESAGVSFGYWLGKDHWGAGYATEAAQAMIDAVFTLTAADRLEANARVINPASRRVLEKCGFRHDGSRLKAMPARGGMFPCDDFSLDRKTWASLRNWAALTSWAAPGAAMALVEESLAT
jgi:RimJ/RimL family protein N-acetyltransferase